MTQLTAGTGISLDPLGGTGIVKITATGAAAAVDSVSKIIDGDGPGGISISPATGVGDVTISSDKEWKLLAMGDDWTEEAIITIKETGVSFTTDLNYTMQRTNVGFLNWPKDPVNEIMFRPENPMDDYCVGGKFTMDLVTSGTGTYPKCQDRGFMGSIFHNTEDADEDDGIKLVINGVDMEYCPSQYGDRSNGTTSSYPGVQGEQEYFSPICYYRAGSDYASSTITELQIKEVDWSPSFSTWKWEIWYR